MKLKPCLRNSVKRGLLLSLAVFVSLFSGCTSSTAPTYLTKDIPQAVMDICREEYNILLVAKLVGSTLWIYHPVKDIFIPADKPEKYIEKFAIDEHTGEFDLGLLTFNYKIKVLPDEEKFQSFQYNKKVREEMNNVWKVLRRVVFSLDRTKKDEPKFYSVVTADIKNGLEIRELFYYLDLKKVSYEFISWGEFSHRTINDTAVAPEATADWAGTHVTYKDFTFEEFIVSQINDRIKQKFQKPEVGQDVDIDKEITKIIMHVVNIYDFKDFQQIELNNLLTGNRIILNEAAVQAALKGQRF